MTTPPVGAIVLAGGASRRMGRQKLLLPYGKSTLLETIVDTLLTAPLAGVVVVTGHSHGAIVERLGDRKVHIVHNAAYDEGMLSSARAGLRAAPGEWAGYLIALGDQPTLELGTVEALLGAAGAPIAVPVCEGRRGHPLYFARRFREAVLTRYDDDGLRGLLREHADCVREIPVTTAGIHVDVDKPEDYAALMNRTED